MKAACVWVGCAASLVVSHASAEEAPRRDFALGMSLRGHVAVTSVEDEAGMAARMGSWATGGVGPSLVLRPYPDDPLTFQASLSRTWMTGTDPLGFQRSSEVTSTGLALVMGPVEGWRGQVGAGFDWWQLRARSFGEHTLPNGRKVQLNSAAGFHTAAGIERLLGRSASISLEMVTRFHWTVGGGAPEHIDITTGRSSRGTFLAPGLRLGFTGWL